MKEGFTLIELLVVVLIIGILASIALPQYTRAVEKAKMAEALTNASVLIRAKDMYLLQEGTFPTGSANSLKLKDLLFSTGIELSGGEWQSDTIYRTKTFAYEASCYNSSGTNTCEILASRTAGLSYLYVLDISESVCYTQQTDIGRAMCKSIEGLGWEYTDDFY